LLLQTLGERKAKMIVWQYIRNDHDGTGAVYFERKADAEKFRREDDQDLVSDINKIKVTDRISLASALNEAVGYGGS
jgi:hypothetical protein